MVFGWINLFGAMFVILLIITNILYAVKNKGEKNHCINRFMNFLEQVGRYGCILLMWFPLLVWKFGFASVIEMVLYCVGNPALLATYWVLFAAYRKKKTACLAICLAVIPFCVFLLSGILLRHWLLFGFAAAFAISHVYVTSKNVKTINHSN